MENGNDEKKIVCPKCGGPVAQQVDVLAGAGTLVLAKQRSAISLGVMRGSTLLARVCTTCGYAELYATNPEVLR